MNKRIPTEHPGRILLEDFLAPKGVSVWRLANEIGFPARRLYEIVQGQRPINADIAHRLTHYFDMSERYWLDLQARYDRKGEDLFVLFHFCGSLLNQLDSGNSLLEGRSAWRVLNAKTLYESFSNDVQFLCFATERHKRATYSLTRGDPR